MQSNNQTNSQNLNDESKKMINVNPHNSASNKIDDLIAVIDDYISNPTRVNRITLEKLRDELIDLRTSIVGEGLDTEEYDNEKEMDMEKSDKPLSIIITMLTKKNRANG